LATRLKDIAILLGVYRQLKKIKIILNDLAKFKTLKQIKEEEFLFYSAFIKPGQLCFDVGANVGDKSEIFIEIGASVVAIEPQKECIKRLKRRFINKANFLLVPYGLSDKSGNMTLKISPKSNTISTMSQRWENEGRFSNDYTLAHTENVVVTTLDKIIMDYGCPDYIKIDVEGFEFNVIRGLSIPVKLVSFEFVDEFLDEAVNCINYLSKLGKVTLNVILGNSKSFIFDDFVETGLFLTYLNNLDNQEACGDIFVKIDHE